MKRILPLCLVVFILLGYMFPVQPVKADQGTEVTFTDSQYSQIGAWALANNLITGVTDEYNYANLPVRAPMTPADFLIAVGKSIVTKNPAPLIEFGYNLEEDIINELKADLNDLWDSAKDFFYELFFGSPQSTLSIDDFIDTSFQIGLDGLNQAFASQGDGDVPVLPSDYAWFQAINSFYFDTVSFDSVDRWYGENGVGLMTPINPMSSYSYFITGTSYLTKSFHLSDNGQSSYPDFAQMDMTAYAPKLSIYYDSSTNTCTYSASNSTKPFSAFSGYTNLRYFYSSPAYVQDGIYVNGHNNDLGDFRSEFDSITVALNWFYSHFYNINFYVDDVLWVGGSPALPPVSSGQLTYPNGEPAVREFPVGTQIDWDELYNRIYQAIVDGLVLDFSDIDDCIVDVNGQPAVASLRLVRTDYDKLYLEQYSNDINLPFFPATLTTGEAQAVVGGTVGHIISPYNPSNPALNEDSVIPSDIARILYVGVFLTLFACVINRLLE